MLMIILFNVLRIIVVMVFALTISTIACIYWILFSYHPHHLAANVLWSLDHLRYLYTSF